MEIPKNVVETVFVFFFFRGKVSAPIDKDLQSSFSTQNCRLRIRD